MEQQDYNKTLNLPVTEFPMRAGLPTREPEALKQWQDESPGLSPLTCAQLIPGS